MDVNFNEYQRIYLDINKIKILCLFVFITLTIKLIISQVYNFK